MSRDDESAALAHQQELDGRRRQEDELLANDPGYSLFLAEVAALNAIEQLLRRIKPNEISSESDG